MCIDGNHATAFLIRVQMSLDSSEDTLMINIDNMYSRHMGMSDKHLWATLILG